MTLPVLSPGVQPIYESPELGNPGVQSSFIRFSSESRHLFGLFSLGEPLHVEIQISFLIASTDRLQTRHLV